MLGGGKRARLEGAVLGGGETYTFVSDSAGDLKTNRIRRAAGNNSRTQAAGT